MTAWWYADGDKKIGPVALDELQRRFEKGLVIGTSLVWREGLESWQPLNSVDELHMFQTAIPPPLPPKSDFLASRWSRFFARTFDYWCEVALVVACFVFVLATYSPTFAAWLATPGAPLLFVIICLPIALALDAFLYRIFGNTPGKAMLGLVCVTSTGKALSFSQYLARNISIWIKGFGLGVPIVNLFTMAYQHRRLGRGQQASYDEATGTKVVSKPIGWLRKASFALALSSFFVAGVVLDAGIKAWERTPIGTPSAATKTLEPSQKSRADLPKVTPANGYLKGGTFSSREFLADAREKGYSDKEIAAYLCKDRGLDIEEIYRRGYSDAEIIAKELGN